MTTKHKIEFIIAVVVIVAAVALYIVLGVAEKRAEETVVIGAVTAQTQIKSVPAEAVPPPTAVSASVLARIFVERFGSHSSEADYQNILDVLPLVTASYANELEGLMKRKINNLIYSGVSTYVVNALVIDESATEAEVKVLTRRVEAVGAVSETATREQTAVVSLEKNGEDWLVSGLVWE